ncbi:Protein NipSnap-like protein 1-like [Oopsacas minuta]|uniref:Protein NipSnap-like protein 1-like n=1 Tax=Oopsacas minuta TaxID=111878 RepID=A0AAV7JLL5_9METZ|nr:Protein NipSnap-like protein 1-like [Oopsacas minuta]
MSALRLAITCLRAKGSYTRSVRSKTTLPYYGRSHSKVLAENSKLFELIIHDVKPECESSYWPLVEKELTRISADKNLPVSLVGSWGTLVGKNLDQATHVLAYEDGYKGKTNCLDALSRDKEWQMFSRESGKLVNRRKSSLLYEFTFWPEIVPTNRGWIFEMRTYNLKSGSLIEWGQAWRQGIYYRGSNNEAVHGWFAQIGQLHIVYHLWTYPDLVQRRETRQLAWNTPGWDDCVINTVPLIITMDTAILSAASFSPLK